MTSPMGLLAYPDRTLSILAGGQLPVVWLKAHTCYGLYALYKALGLRFGSGTVPVPRARSLEDLVFNILLLYSYTSYCCTNSSLQ
jgi:hypothetical protein